MGSVYQARDVSLGRDVAVKTIRTAGRSDFQLEVFMERFDHEARALAALAHPNVVNVYDVGVAGETPFLVMELVGGRSLAERIAEEGPLDPDEVRVLGRQLASALDAAHARSIIHRDVKPANVLEAAPGVWKLADFGVAHVPDSSLTLTGQFLGSPAYAAPEVFAAGAFSPASDVYSLGATLYEALAGEPPHGQGGLLGAGLLSADAAPIEISGAPADLTRALGGALERDFTRRLGAGQIAEILAPRRAGSSWKPAAIAVGVVMLVVGITLGASLGGGGGGEPSSTPAPALQPDRERDEPIDERAARQNERDWRKVDRELRKGKIDKALDHLEKILERDSDDREAADLYRQITGHDWDGG
jgi:serine/threonine protein kinase